MRSHRIKALLFLSFVFNSCTSPKEFLGMGDYYNASVKSIKKLNIRPSINQRHVLAESYPRAIQNINENLQNTMEFAAINKWKFLDQEYRKINTLNDLINSSRVNLEIDRHLLTDLQKKASEISFGTDRRGSQEYKAFEQTYKLTEKRYVDFIHQPKTKSILEVGYQEINDSDWSYVTFQSEVLEKLNCQLMHIRTNEGKGVAPSLQTVKIIFHGFKEDSTIITQTSFGSATASTIGGQVTNSLNNAPPEAYGRKPNSANFQPGSDFNFRYSITIKCSASVVVFDQQTKSILLETNLEGNDTWISQWYRYRSNYDNSLSPKGQKAIRWGLNEFDFLKCRNRYQELYDRSNQSLKKKLISRLTEFYGSYLL